MLALIPPWTLFKGALLFLTRQPQLSNSRVDGGSQKQQHAFFNYTISPLPCTVSSSLDKPGKTLPLVSLSQEKKSGTGIQMITELGKPSLCPPLPFVPSLRRPAPHQLVLICLAAVKALAAPMASL